jgi:hypothetical protein
MTHLAAEMRSHSGREARYIGVDDPVHIDVASMSPNRTQVIGRQFPLLAEKKGKEQL